VIVEGPLSETLPGLLARAGSRRVLLLTGPSRRHAEAVRAALAGGGFSVELYDGARRHVPEAVARAARQQVAGFAADTIVALGGGSTIGVGKALRRETPELRFVAVPTTYAGSERTDMFGITSGGNKTTGRDPKVRPDAIVYDVELTLDMPRTLTVTSLMNALAHPVGTLATGSLAGERREQALRAIEMVYAALEALVQAPRDRRARALALRAAGLAAEALEAGTPGLHHKLAHRLGGRFDLDHAGLHAVLLPHSLRRLRDETPALLAEIDGLLRVPDPEGALFDLLIRAGAPASLRALGVAVEAFRELAAGEGEPAVRELLAAVFRGRRPSRATRLEDWGLPQPVSVRGPRLEEARRVVVALHGSGGTADGALRQAVEIAADDPTVAVVAPQADGDELAPAEAEAILARARERAGAERVVHWEEHARVVRDRIAARVELRGHAAAVAPALGGGGFGGFHESEDLPGALPRDRNSPRAVSYGLYAEQLSATGFVAPRAENARSWLYRIRPSAHPGALAPLGHETFRADFDREPPEPNLAGFAPPAIPAAPTDFVDGLITLGGAGSARLRRGYAVHVYAANRSMDERCFYDADGDLLLLPQLGALTLLTEMGVLEVAPGALAIIPRGVRFSVLLAGPEARGYVAEPFGRRFTLPERGPVGANGLAEARHFRAPTAWHEDRLAPGYRLTAKVGGELYQGTRDYSPFDVVAWHGNACPYVYDLALFSPVGNTRFDHGDPSIYTVLTAPLDETGAHSLDLVVFPPRWDPTEGTFRPPYFHRNVTAEWNGIIRDELPPDSPFQPGGCFVTPGMAPHGVLASSVERALDADPSAAAAADRPRRVPDDSLWFQFESALPISLTSWAKRAPLRIADWHLIWGAYRSHFRVD
jgi:homogentisate 1,2-dioxygenase